MKSHRRFRQTTRRSVGSFALGKSWKDCGLNFSPHQGQFSRGIGAGLRSSFWKAIVFDRAEFGSLSPLKPIRFGVAARPTQRPISNGQGPRVSGSLCRSSSRAQISVAARLSWSRVSRRSV